MREQGELEIGEGHSTTGLDRPFFVSMAEYRASELGIDLGSDTITQSSKGSVLCFLYSTAKAEKLRKLSGKVDRESLTREDTQAGLD